MAEKLVNEFTVNRPIDEAWPLICDLEKIAPCMPGAQLEEVEGDVYRGSVSIKLGSVATKFKGEAEFVERDDTNHTATLLAQGRDSKGRGNAKADIHAKAESLSPTSTQVKIETDLTMAGRVAQIGRSGIMADVSKKLVNEFASNLNKMIDDDGAASAANDTPTPSPTTAAAGSSTAAAGSSTTAAGSSTTAAGSSTAAAGSSTGRAPSASSSSGSSGAETGGPKVRKINGPAAEPIEVTNLAGAAVAKRAVPIGLGLIALVWLVRKLF